MKTSAQKAAINNAAKALKSDFIDECDRLLNSWAIAETLKPETIIRVALENLSERYRLDVDEYQNLRKF